MLWWIMKEAQLEFLAEFRILWNFENDENDLIYGIIVREQSFSRKVLCWDWYYSNDLFY